MKKTMWGQSLPALLLALVLCLTLLPTAAFAAEEKHYSGEDDGMVWDFDQATGTLTISGTMHEVYFEEAYKSALYYGVIYGYTWPWKWAGWDKEIVSVVIQDGVTEIPDAARGTSGSTNQNGPFYGCENLTSVTIPDSVTKIGSWAFFNCSGLTSVAIPDSVTSIGEGAFYHCSSLASVTIPDGVTKIESWTFLGCDGLTSVTIPDSVTEIGKGAFQSCENLSQVELGSGVETIGEQAFWIGAYSRPKITNITLPSSIKEADLSGIDHVILDDSWTRIGPDVKLTGRHATLTIPAGVTEILSGNLGDEIKIIRFKGTFAQWQAISGASGFPEKLRNVRVSYGDGSEGLNIAGTVLKQYDGDGGDVVIPEGVTEIGFEAFRSTWGGKVTSVTIPNSVGKIGAFAFANDEELVNVTLPAGLTTIDNGVFYGCKSLTSITIPASVTSIGNKAFNSSGLKTICGVPGSYAETYAKQNGYAFQSIGTTGPAGKFTDLSPTGFYLDAVAWAVEKNIAKGTTDTTFSPKENCTHGQILTFLWRAAGEPASNAATPFAMNGGEYYYGAAKWAYEKGMIGADFKHGTLCTRADAVNYIWQAAGKDAASYDGRFTDIPANSPYATAVAWAVEKNITKGTADTTFSPDKICNRGEIVTFLHRAYK